MTEAPRRTQAAARQARRPLAPWVFLHRNASRSAPLTGVIVLAVLLVMGIVAMMNSIPLSIRTIYGYSRSMVVVTPRGDASAPPRIEARIRAESPVPLARVIACRGSPAMVESIVGQWPFAVIAMEQEDMRFFLRRLGVARIDGRLPGPGAPEAIVSEPVLRNLGLRLGDPLLDPGNPEAYSPFPVRIVGVAHTQEWLMLAPVEYHRAHHFPPVDVIVAFAQDPRDQPRLDAWVEEAFRGERAEIFSFTRLERETAENFRILYTILNVVIGALVAIITLMAGMLMNIHQAQRIQEYALLQALGHTRRRLVRRAVAEAALVTGAGWAAGVALGIAALHAVNAWLMHPRAFALDPMDPLALLYTLPAPLAILIAAAWTVWRRFRRFDPIGVVERRLT
jgi:putative ABC transport system permease protein/lipoprotein-releasing system permease protein